MIVAKYETEMGISYVHDDYLLKGAEREAYIELVKKRVGRIIRDALIRQALEKQEQEQAPSA